MNNFTDIQIATEILAIELSKNIFNKEKLKTLLKEKELVASGDNKTITKVINTYGKKVKEEANDERNDVY